MRAPRREQANKNHKESSVLLAPTPEIDHLLSVRKAADAQADKLWRTKNADAHFKWLRQLHKDPEVIYPGRNNFLSAIRAQPRRSLPGGSYLRLLDDSKVRCGSIPTTTPNFIKVRVTSGTLNGQIGWVCETDVFRTLVIALTRI